MPRRSTIETHPQREEIEHAILDDTESFRSIAQRFGVTDTALIRYRDSHMAQKTVMAIAEKEACSLLDGERILEEMEAIRVGLRGIVERAERDGKDSIGVSAYDKLIKLIGTVTALSREYREERESRAAADITKHAQWGMLREAIVEATDAEHWERIVEYFDSKRA